MKFSLVLSSLCAGILLFLACGPESEIENKYYRFFSQEVGHADTYRPFFRSFNFLYQGDPSFKGMKSNNINDFDSTNVAEWAKLFGGKVATIDIDRLLYKASLGEVDTLIFKLKDPAFPVSDKLSTTTLFSYPDKNLIRAFLFYLGYAKRCESVACYAPDWYEPDTTAQNPRNNTLLTDSLLNGGEKLLKKAKNAFIRERYIFQITRLLFFSKKYGDSYTFYTENADRLKLSASMKYRCMGYAAAALMKLKRTAEANYFYSLIYDNCPQMKVNAYISFSPTEESDWKQSLDLARSPRQKAVLWQLVGIYHDPQRAMEEIYRLDPKSDLLDLLLVRMVALAEETAMPKRDEDAKDYFSFGIMHDVAPSPMLRFVKYIADDHKTAKPYLWDLSYGYLSFMHGNTNEANIYLDKAGKEAPDDQLVADQIHLIKIGILLHSYNLPPAEFEKVVLRELQWLKERKSEWDDAFEIMPYGGVYQWALGRLAQTYVQIGDYTKAECLHYMTDPAFYLDAQKTGALLAFIEKPDKSEFEKFVLSVYPFSYDNVCDFQGVTLFYQGKLKEAESKFLQGSKNRTPAEGHRRSTGPDGTESSCLTELLADPFIIHVKDCHDCDAAAPQKVKYTKLGFVTRMLELEQKLKTNPGDATELYFELANGYYNASYFGNARLFYETAMKYYGTYAIGIRPSAYILDCSKALECYTKAMELSSDPEFKARCAFMAAKCEQNEFYRKTWEKQYYDNSANLFKGGSYFKQLRDSFSQTKYYQEIIKECGYFRTYVGG